MNKDVFPYDLIVKNKADGSKYPFQLMENFTYIWKHNGILKGYVPEIFEIKVPKLYESDFGSIPRPFQGIFNAVNDIAPAALVHDWAYSIELFPREICDKLFYSALRDNGVGWWRAHTLYKAVRGFGWTSWPHDPTEIAEDRQLYREAFGKD